MSGYLVTSSLRCGSRYSCYTPTEIHEKAFRKPRQDKEVFWGWERLSRGDKALQG